MAKPFEASKLWDPPRSRVPQTDWDTEAFDAADAPPRGNREASNPPGGWDVQIDQLKARLEQAEGEAPAAEKLPTRADLKETLALLERMYADLSEVHAQRKQLEQQLFEVRAALVAAKNQMAGMQSSERKARYQARHDGLTMLPNRSYFHERLEEALARAAEHKHMFAVLFIDLDGFKQINDLYGHDTGDELLRVVGARLARAVRSTDMVSRLGGDEFGCMLADLSASRQEIERIVDKLHNAISMPFRLGNRSLAVRPSIGIAMYPTDGRTTAVLLRRADTAMYSAKAARSGHQFFDPALHD